MMEDCTRLAIYGLGGCGKTALALQLAYRIREQEPAHSILWVSALGQESFEQAYQEIGKLLCILGIEDNKSNVKIEQFVEETLSNEEELDSG
jgi:GTPase SAR1 family protein